MKKIITSILTMVTISTFSFAKDSMSNKDRYIMMAVVNQSIEIQATISLGQAGSWEEINKNKKKVKQKMRSNCKKMALEMKNKYPNAEIYDYTLKNCIALSFSQLD